MPGDGVLIETERLRLRPYSLDDLDALTGILCDAHTMKYYPRVFTRAEAKAWIERNLVRYQRDGFGLWAIESKQNSMFLGNCGPVKQTVEGTHEVEIGWHVHRDHWRQGIATEAGVACRDYAFAELGLRRVISLILEQNVPSRRVAEKLGMAVEKEAIFAGLPHLVYVVEKTPISSRDESP